MEHYSSACPAPSQTDTSNTSVDQTTLPVSLPPEQDLDANQDCLVHAFGQLDIENQLLMAERMFAQLGRVFRHAVQAHHIDLGAPDWHNRLRQADENSRQGNRDTEALRWIRTVLEQLRTLDSEDLVEAANVLANASRDGMQADFNMIIMALTQHSFLAKPVWAIWPPRVLLTVIDSGGWGRCSPGTGPQIRR